MCQLNYRGSLIIDNRNFWHSQKRSGYFRSMMMSKKEKEVNYFFCYCLSVTVYLTARTFGALYLGIKTIPCMCFFTFVVFVSIS